MKKIKSILIVLIIINILTLIYLLIRPKVENYNIITYASEQYSNDNSNSITNKCILKFENEIDLLSKYIGEIPTGNVNVKFTDLIEGGFEEIYKATEGMDENGLVNYLNRNSEDIAMKTGITEFNDFANFIQKIQIYRDSNIKCEKAEIIEGSYVNGNKYDTFKVQLSYDNGQALVFNVSLSNRDFIDTPIIIIK